jgi:hypothetical protein
MLRPQQPERTNRLLLLMQLHADAETTRSPTPGHPSVPGGHHGHQRVPQWAPTDRAAEPVGCDGGKRLGRRPLLAGE